MRVPIIRVTGGGSVEDEPVREAYQPPGPFTLPLGLDVMEFSILEELRDAEVEVHVSEIERRLLILLGAWKGSDHPCVWLGSDGFPVGLSEMDESAPTLRMGEALNG